MFSPETASRIRAVRESFAAKAPQPAAAEKPPPSAARQAENNPRQEVVGGQKVGKKKSSHEERGTPPKAKLPSTVRPPLGTKPVLSSRPWPPEAADDTTPPPRPEAEHALKDIPCESSTVALRKFLNPPETKEPLPVTITPVSAMPPMVQPLEPVSAEPAEVTEVTGVDALRRRIEAQNAEAAAALEAREFAEAERAAQEAAERDARFSTLLAEAREATTEEREAEAEATAEKVAQGPAPIEADGAKAVTSLPASPAPQSSPTVPDLPKLDHGDIESLHRKLQRFHSAGSLSPQPLTLAALPPPSPKSSHGGSASSAAGAVIDFSPLNAFHNAPAPAEDSPWTESPPSPPNANRPTPPPRRRRSSIGTHQPLTPQRLFEPDGVRGRLLTAGVLFTGVLMAEWLWTSAPELRAAVARSLASLVMRPRLRSA